MFFETNYPIYKVFKSPSETGANFNSVHLQQPVEEVTYSAAFRIIAEKFYEVFLKGISKVPHRMGDSLLSIDGKSLLLLFLLHTILVFLDVQEMLAACHMQYCKNNNTTAAKKEKTIRVSPDQNSSDCSLSRSTSLDGSFGKPPPWLQDQFEEIDDGFFNSGASSNKNLGLKRMQEEFGDKKQEEDEEDYDSEPDVLKRNHDKDQMDFLMLTSAGKATDASYANRASDAELEEQEVVDSDEDFAKSSKSSGNHQTVHVKTEPGEEPRRPFQHFLNTSLFDNEEVEDDFDVNLATEPKLKKQKKGEAAREAKAKAAEAAKQKPNAKRKR